MLPCTQDFETPACQQAVKVEHHRQDCAGSACEDCKIGRIFLDALGDIIAHRRAGPPDDLVRKLRQERPVQDQHCC